MSLALTYALSCLAFTGLIDILFKRYARKARSRGLYLAGMGVVWAGLQTVTGGLAMPDQATLLFGIAAGVLVTASNLMLIESMTHLDASLGSTIYRLNSVGVVVLSALLLDEPLGGLKLGGIALAVAAVLCLHQPGGASERRRLLRTYIGVAIAASALRAGYGVATKMGLLAGADANQMMLVAALCWTVGGLGYALTRERRPRLAPVTLAYAAASGVVVFTIVTLLVLALAHGEASVVIPITNLGFVVALLLARATGMERLTPRKLLAMGLAATAIVVLSRVA